MRSFIAAGLLALALSWAGAPRATAADAPVDRFFGTYQGRSIQSADSGLSARDLSVAIRAHDEGFEVSWTTVIHRAGGTKHAAYAIDFVPTERPNIFQSAMRRDVFGHAEPLDPMRGEPFVWARIAGDTLTVYALLIDDEGGYEIQTYDRTLTADGLALRFSRDRDGRALAPVTGTLKRTGP